jgi:hypothetical protein
LHQPGIKWALHQPGIKWAIASTRDKVGFASTRDKVGFALIAHFIPGINVVSTTHLSPESKNAELQGLLESADRCMALITPQTMADVVMQQQIEAALDSSKDVMLIHDLRQPNEFSDILAACPQSLRDKGVFDHLAVALYGGDYEHTRLNLLWQRLSSEEGDSERRGSNFFARNSIVMPLPQPACPNLPSPSSCSGEWRMLQLHKRKQGCMQRLATRSAAVGRGHEQRSYLPSIFRRGKFWRGLGTGS